jgi:hypothetical protein
LCQSEDTIAATLNGMNLGLIIQNNYLDYKSQEKPVKALQQVISQRLENYKMTVYQMPFSQIETLDTWLTWPWSQDHNT